MQISASAATARLRMARYLTWKLQGSPLLADTRNRPVAGAVQAAVGTGACMVNVHASGGSAMMKAAAAAARTSADTLGLQVLGAGIAVFVVGRLLSRTAGKQQPV